MFTASSKLTLTPIIQTTMTSKKTVLITGCSDGGIGSDIALTFHQRGYHVLATARDTSKMFAPKDLPRMTLLILDVEDPTHTVNAVKTVESKTGGTLDILINNSGRNHFMPVLDINRRAGFKLGFKTFNQIPLVISCARLYITLTKFSRF